MDILRSIKVLAPVYVASVVLYGASFLGCMYTQIKIKEAPQSAKRAVEISDRISEIENQLNSGINVPLRELTAPEESMKLKIEKNRSLSFIEERERLEKEYIDLMSNSQIKKEKEDLDAFIKVGSYMLYTLLGSGSLVFTGIFAGVSRKE